MAFSVAVLCLAGCQATRYVPEGKHLLRKNSINGVKIKMARELRPYIRQKPNERFLSVFPARLWLYNKGKRMSEQRITKFSNWLMSKVGEAPVLADSALADRSVHLMKLYLKSRGYFNAAISYQMKTKRKKAKIIYDIAKGRQYFIRRLIYPGDDGGLNRYLRRDSANAYLQPGEPYDTDVIRDERKRISRRMRNLGYFFFSKEYVHFKVDSSVGAHQVDIHVNIHEPAESAIRQRYMIRNIYVYPDYEVMKQATPPDLDTVTLPRFPNYYVLTMEPKRYNWKVLLHAIQFGPGQRYNFQDKHDMTLRRLSDLGLFRFSDLRYERIDTGTAQPMLDVYVRLTPAKKQDLSVEVEGNTGTQTIVGTAVKSTYRNKNVLKGAEVFTFNINGGIESQVVDNAPFFNTFDLNTQLDFMLHKFLLPISRERLSPRLNPKTRFSVRYNFQRRPDLTLSSSNLSLSYDWREVEGYDLRKKAFMHHTVSPIVINHLRAHNFSDRLLDLKEDNPFLQKSLESQFILGSSYTFVHDGSFKQELKYWFYRFHVDVSGNTTRGVNLLANKLGWYENEFRFFNIGYSQFVKVELDLRKYIRLSKNSKFVARIYPGIGAAYGNSEVLPYVKQFFVGGANSMRGWRVRTLGPGSFNFRDTSTTDRRLQIFDQTGDIKFETNLEYRFGIFKSLKGAVFMDIGNIWGLRADTSRPGAVFFPEDFLNELAIGTGAGIRLDFSYFIIRVDLGIKLRDPAFLDDDPWVIKRYKDSNWKDQFNYRMHNFNIAIGYPF